MIRGLSVYSVLFGLCLASSSPAVAADLGPERTLRKMKMRLTGHDQLTKEERESAQAQYQNPDQWKNFLNRKAKDYLAHPNHVERMIYRLEALFRISTHYFPVEFLNDARFEQVKQIHLWETNSSTNHLFRRIIEKNETWDQLFIASEFKPGPWAGSEALDKTPSAETNNLNVLFPSFVGVPSGSTEPPPLLKLPPEDRRGAGAFSTTRVLSRYGATATNENRRLSAAALRVALCEDLAPAFIPATPGTDVNKEALSNFTSLFPEIPSQPTVGAAPSLTMAEIASLVNHQHGTDAACMVCHEKLDPIAHAFGPAGARQAPPATARGGIFFREVDGPPTDKRDLQLGQVMEELLKRPEYASCQVSHFWNWIMGNTVPLSKERSAELVKVFNGEVPSNDGSTVDRRPSHFIRHLVTEKEFSVDQTAIYRSSLNSSAPLLVTYSQVQPILAKCNLCHLPAVDFSVRPIGGSVEEDKDWVLNMKERIKDGSMPMQPVRRSLTDSQLKLLKDWAATPGIE